MKQVRLTMAQALVRYLSQQWVQIGRERHRLIPGVWAIFGHGNVAGIGHALHEFRDELPTHRSHNEQAMAHAAVAFAKAWRGRRVMACTTSIGPGATNLVTAAAGAYINRLPLLLLPGDTFASRGPDPVLQQLENPADAGMSVNDCLRPVSRVFERIQRPEQLLSVLPRAIQVLTDPAQYGPVTLALAQDTQTEAYDFPAAFFEPKTWHTRRPRPDRRELEDALRLLSAAERPMIIAGGGVLLSQAELALGALSCRLGAPVATTQAGHGSLAWTHPQNVGGLGVTGSACANELAAQADVILAVGTRLSDFTTASRTLFNDAGTIGLNIVAFDAHKQGARPLVADAGEGLRALIEGSSSSGRRAWSALKCTLKSRWQGLVTAETRLSDGLATDAQVVGAVNEAAGDNAVVVCAAGGLPGALHKLYQPSGPGSYHAEYGYSCMGYEIAGGLGVKMARPDSEVFVLLGDGSYLMMNSELATSVSMNQKIIILLLDNRGFGCIHRLQQATGGAPFNNLRPGREIDFVAHATALGACAERVDSAADLPQALRRARTSDRSYVVVIDTDPDQDARVGGAWWQVALPEVSPRAEVAAARKSYLTNHANQGKG
jgi:3D-(3,5/4)-trihydroxycyclohexane-1,2-dione acylhydrolase (decyclizing)